MVTLDEAVIARLKSHGITFEVLVEPEGALSHRRGEDVSIEDILAVEDIFENATRGDRSSAEDLMKAFGTTDLLTIADKILKKGELHLTSEQRRQITEDRRKRIIEIISRNAINPQTNTPHPPARIEQAMKEAHVNIDPAKSTDELVSITMKALRPLIPIRFEEVSVAVKVLSEYAPKAYGEIAAFGQLEREEWQNDGSWIGVVRLPAGMQDEFYSLINKLTKGTAETRLLKR